jgi:hypothetical protein
MLLLRYSRSREPGRLLRALSDGGYRNWVAADPNRRALAPAEDGDLPFAAAVPEPTSPSSVELPSNVER